MVLKSVGVISCGKICGLVYAAIGVLVGLMFTFFSLIGAAFGTLEDEALGALVGVIFGVGAAIIFPIFYGVLGFLGGLILAGLYNVIARTFGGLEVELQ